MFDSKLSDFLKLTEGQAIALAVTCGLYWVAAAVTWAPPVEGSVKGVLIFGLLLSGSLAAIGIGRRIITAVRNYYGRKASERSTVAYFDRMGEKPRAVLAYLLAHNQTDFTADVDGGYAGPLIGRGIVVISARHGQRFDLADTPFRVPDEVWALLQEHKDKFPYTPPRKGEVVPYPWRVPYGVR